MTPELSATNASGPQALEQSATTIYRTLSAKLLRKKQATIIRNAISGTIGSLLAEAVLFPVDTIKLQVQTASADNTSGFAGTFLSVVSKRGISGLYGGLGAAMVKESVHSFNYWFWHGLLFRYLVEHDDTSKTPTLIRLAVNTLAKQLNWLCTVPFEAISTVNQLSKSRPGFFPTAVSLYREGGIGVFYRGLPVSLLLAVNPAIMNTFITSFLRVVTAFRQAKGEDYFEAREHSASVVGAATALSKTVATIVTYPLIRGKVLQQTSRKPIGLMAALQDVVATEGVKGLYRGVLAMSYKTVLWNTVMMAVKHLLAPSRAITPPGSPAPTVPKSLRVPMLAREPFPVELFTEEKLNEILHYVKLNNSSEQEKRMSKLEEGLKDSKTEMQEVKQLLKEIASSIRPDTNATQKSPHGGRSNNQVRVSSQVEFNCDESEE